MGVLKKPDNQIISTIFKRPGINFDFGKLV
jgi:hypothetical protein